MAVKLSQPQTQALYVNSGGMCAICQKPLLLEEPKDPNAIINIGQRAHIIGSSKKGPRRDKIEETEINEKDLDSNLRNFILLCYEHHKAIDDNPELYEPKALIQIKDKHENWVKRRLNIKERIIAIIHKRHGGPIDQVDIEGQLDGILEDVVGIQEEFDASTPENWKKAKLENIELYRIVNKTKSQVKGTRFSVFPLSPIPLAIHFGYLLTDSVPVSTYQFDRSIQKWVYTNPEKHIQKKMKPDVKLVEKDTAEVLAVSIEVSAKISEIDINLAIPNDAFSFLGISLKDVKIDAVKYKEEVEEIANLFRDSIYSLLEKRPYKEIYLFCAIPAGLAFEIGRRINKNMFPNVHLHHFSAKKSPRHQYALTLD